MSPEAAERLAAALAAALPDADPLDLGPEALERAVRDAGGDPADDALVAAALVAWEALL